MFVSRIIHKEGSSARHYVLLGAVVLAALLPRAWSLGFGLPYRYHVDEPAYVLAALNVARGNFNIAYPPMSPNFHQLVLALVYGLLFGVQFITGSLTSPEAFAQSYQQDPTAFYLAGRLVSLSSSMLSLVVLYVLVRQLRGRQSGLLAALFLAFSFIDVRHAHFIEPYPLVTLFILLAVWASIRYFLTGKTPWLIGGCFTAAVAIGVRYSVAPLALVPVLSIGFRWLQQSKYSLKPVLVGGTSAIVGLVVGVPSLILNFERFLAGMKVQAQLASTNQGFWGLTLNEGPAWRFYAQVLRIGWGIPLLLLAVTGLSVLVWRHNLSDILVLGFPISYVVVLLLAAGSSSAFVRYLVPLQPFFALLAAEGGQFLWQQLKLSSRRSKWLVASASLILIVPPAARIGRLNHLWSQEDTRLQAKVWIEEHLPEGSHITTQWYGPPLATPADPEFGSERTYDVQIWEPFAFTPQLFSLDYYRSQGTEYLILSNFIYDLKRVDAYEQANVQAFYAEIDADAELIGEFRSYAGNTKPVFVFDEVYSPLFSLWQRERPGPIIRVYELSQ